MDGRFALRPTRMFHWRTVKVAEKSFLYHVWHKPIGSCDAVAN